MTWIPNNKYAKQLKVTIYFHSMCTS